VLAVLGLPRRYWFAVVPPPIVPILAARANCWRPVVEPAHFFPFLAQGSPFGTSPRIVF